MKTLTLTIDAEGVALITIAPPDRPMNVWTPELLADVDTAVEQVLGDERIKGAVITSGKPAFLVGADLKSLTAPGAQPLTLIQASHRFDRENALLRRIETGGKPFAAAINGLALGGGLELALACHGRLVADSPKAQLGLPEVNVGLLPAGGGTQRLPRLVGIERALPLLLEGTPLRPQEALKIGLVHEVVPADALLAAAQRWVLDHPGAQQPWDVKGFQVPGGSGAMALQLVPVMQAATTRAKRDGGGRYPAKRAILSAVFEGAQVPLAAGLRIEAMHMARLLVDPVARNLTRTMFIHKGEADKLARRPAGVPKQTVRKLGVLGAGMMGAGIAHVAAQTGIDVVLIDATQAAADKGKAYSAKLLQKALERGSLNAEQVEAQLARITATTDYSLLSSADLVIEAVFEQRAVKREVTQRAAAVMSAGALFASNTSTLPIGGLAIAYPREDQFIGMHFFSPVERMPLLEIIRGKATSDAAVARALDFAAQLKKTPIVVNDSPGFFTSRVIGTYIDEGMAMLAEGVAPALIENAARQAGFPTGPLAIVDETSVELSFKVHEQAVNDGLDARFQRLTAITVIKKMLHELGRNGRRTGAGFYDYPEAGKKSLWPGLAAAFPWAAEQPDAAELQMRFLVIQALEAARCVEEGIITHAADADLGSILGIGYPSWTGGVLSYVDTLGLTAFVAECDRLAEQHGHRFAPSETLRARAQRGERFHHATA